VALSPPIPSLPPGAGNQADKLESDGLELGEKGYGDRLGQLNGQVPAIGANGDGREVALPVELAHL
jgi:hypothetical protein